MRTRDKTLNTTIQDEIESVLVDQLIARNSTVAAIKQTVLQSKAYTVKCTTEIWDSSPETSDLTTNLYKQRSITNKQTHKLALCQGGL